MLQHHAPGHAFRQLGGRSNDLLNRPSVRGRFDACKGHTDTTVRRHAPFERLLDTRIGLRSVGLDRPDGEPVGKIDVDRATPAQRAELIRYAFPEFLRRVRPGS